MPNEMKMDREQFETLICMLDAIYLSMPGLVTEQSQAARSKALDYVGRERGIAKGYIPEEEPGA